MKRLLLLFLSMMKIGLFTFGGGYAMIPLLENEFVSKRGWIGDEEFFDMVAVSESTPGPIAVNMATYVGYRVGGVVGAILGTVGIVLPSFAVIFLISLVFQRFIAIAWVAAAFRGIRIAVVFLIFSAAWRLFRRLPKKPFPLTVFSLVTATAVTLSLLSVRFSSVWFILIGAGLGLTACLFAVLPRNCRGEGDK